MTTLHCSGWWEQHGYGRQPMEGLTLQFKDGRLSGSGYDIVGEFVFSGTLVGNEVHLVKQYIGQHTIDYHGVSDGEGVYFGKWSCHGIVGSNWMIRVEQAESESGFVDVRAAEAPE